MEYIIATNNEKKLSELSAILKSRGCTALSLRQAGIKTDPEETGKTFEENALIKAKSACAASGLPAIADDSGLEVDALGGEPGIYSARYCEGSDMDRVKYLLDKMQDVPDDKRGARFVSAIACVWPDGREVVARGTCEGSITRHCAGDRGFGYDPIFLEESLGLTFAEMPAGIKNKISHRARALAAFAEKLEELGL